MARPDRIALAGDQPEADQYAPLFPSDPTTSLRLFPTIATRQTWLDREVQRAVEGKRAAGVGFVLERLAWAFLRQEPRLPWEAVGRDLRAVEAFMRREMARATAREAP